MYKPHREGMYLCTNACLSECVHVCLYSCLHICTTVCTHVHLNVCRQYTVETAWLLRIYLCRTSSYIWYLQPSITAIPFNGVQMLLQWHVTQTIPQTSRYDIYVFVWGVAPGSGTARPSKHRSKVRSWMKFMTPHSFTQKCIAYQNTFEVRTRATLTWLYTCACMHVCVNTSVYTCLCML